MTVFGRFGDEARRVITLALDEARRLKHDFLGTEHLLLGMLCLGSGPAFDALAAAGIDLEAGRARVEALVGTGTGLVGRYAPLTERARKVLEGSAAEADRLGRREIGPEHVLLSLLAEGQGAALQVLAARGLDRLRSDVLSRLGPAPE